MTLEELVGRNVRQARIERGWSQQRLGDELTRYLGRPLSRKAVSVLENGGRDFRVVELVSLALALNCPLAGLFRSTGSKATSDVIFGGSYVVDTQLLLAHLLTGSEAQQKAAHAYAFGAVTSYISSVRTQIQEAMRELEGANEVAREMEQVAGRLTETGEKR